MALGHYFKRRKPAPQPPLAPRGAAQPSTTLIDALTPWLTRLEPARIGEDYIHASSLWDLCTRQRVLATTAKTPAQQVIAPQDATTFDIGKALHDWVRDRWLGPMGWLWGEWECVACCRVVREATMPARCGHPGHRGRHLFRYLEREVRNEEWKIVGHLDGLERDRARGLGILELKTIDGNLFRYLKMPQAEHVFRIHVYCWLAGLTTGRILYVSKAQARLPFKEFLVHFDLRVVERVKDALVDVRHGGTRSCKTPTDARALSCAFARPCWARKERRP